MCAPQLGEWCRGQSRAPPGQSQPGRRPARQLQASLQQIRICAVLLCCPTAAESQLRRTDNVQLWSSLIPHPPPSPTPVSKWGRAGASPLPQLSRQPNAEHLPLREKGLFRPASDGSSGRLGCPLRGRWKAWLVPSNAASCTQRSETQGPSPAVTSGQRAAAPQLDVLQPLWSCLKAEWLDSSQGEGPFALIVESLGWKGDAAPW